MQLKDYQQAALDDFRYYLSTLAEARDTAEQVAAFLRSTGRAADTEDWCRKAWEHLGTEQRLPLVKDVHGQTVVPPCISRRDGLNQPIPNVCLKLPTGGGKTLVACGALELLHTQFFKRQTGFVVWVVPSDAIYRQTWAALADREHAYRQRLERASAGRIKLLKKTDAFTPADVENYLCVMVIMLQAGAVKAAAQVRRKMFQDSGRLPAFFPEVDDPIGNKSLLSRVPNLDVNEIGDDEFRAGGLTIKQSLGNVFRLIQPAIVIDEGHKAYSTTARDFLQGFNPRFMLELSATPNSGRERLSNVLIAVSGTALQKEEMIKLPINLANFSGADWKHTLTQAKVKLHELEQTALRVQGNENRYVRPILIARVERTGKDQLDGLALHAETVRDFLQTQLGVAAEEVKVKSAELDELDRVELLSDTCPVRFIITKNALQEGWDCPFAYVLALLDATAARTAITQMVGRILRQPGARWTTEPQMNECYVFTYNQTVQEAVDQVRRGLQSEGMGDLADYIRPGKEGALGTVRREAIRRREQWRGRKIFLPRVLSKHPDSGDWRLFDYERDLLRRIDWAALRFSKQEEFAPNAGAALERTVVRVDTASLRDKTAAARAAEVRAEEMEIALELPALVRLLLDVVPNPWQGARIVLETLSSLRRRGFSEEAIFTDRLSLLKVMHEDLREQVHAASEAVFRSLLESGDVSFRLEASSDEQLNWELAETLELDVLDTDRLLYRENGSQIERCLVEKIYEKQLNGLERDLAWYLDSAEAVQWWHRIAVRQDWHIQGWRRNKVYPDFLVCLEETEVGTMRLTVLETKGLHLKGSEDTVYKERLFELLTRYAANGVAVGELDLELAQQKMKFELMLESDWRSRLPNVLASS
jgi:type III restriction enzyme